MDRLFDDVARILADPTPRRKALKLIGGVLAGGLFSSVAFGQSSTEECSGRPAGSACPSNSDKQCCGQFCLGGGIGNPPVSAACCPHTFRCPPTRCCVANGFASCCPPGTCFNVHLEASANCHSLNGAVPASCTTDATLCA